MKITRRGIFAALFGLPVAAKVVQAKTVEETLKPQLFTKYIDIPPGDHETLIVPGVPGKRIELFGFNLVPEKQTIASLRDGNDQHIFSSPLLLDRWVGVYSSYKSPGFLMNSVVIKSSSLGKIAGYLVYSVV